MRAEIDEMVDVLMGREPAPISFGTATLMEVASMYFARAKEMELHLHRAEAMGVVTRSSGHYKFRTGELRDFVEMTKSASELGSRRLSALELEFNIEGASRLA